MAEIIVDQTDLNLTITPNTTQLNVFTGGYACAQGNTTEFQYNNGGVLAGANGLTYNSGTQTTTAANLAVTNDANLGAVGNVTITGGNVNQFLQTDGAGGLSFADVANANYANFAGTVLTNAQPNITSLGNLSNLTVTGNVTANYYLGNGSQLTGIAPGDSISNGTSNVRVNSANGNVSIGVNGNANILVATANGIVVTRANLGNVSNLTITGGINGYVLQTDGTGNLSWTAGGSPTGNGVPGGANTQIQFNDGGAFGGKAGFTFNRVTDVMNTPGNLVVAGLLFGDGGLLSNIPGGAFISNGNSNIRIATANGNATISVAGNANIVTVTGTGANISGTLDITSNLTINANTISNGAIFANSGQVRAHFMAANTANITGNLVTGNANLGNAAVANYFIGNGSLLTGLPDNTSIANGNANVRTFANANVTISAAGNANIFVATGTGVNVAGTLNATGNANVGNLGATNIVGTLATAAQPSITSLGTLTGLGVNGNITAANITANTGVFTGNGSGLSSIAGANVTGTVANATHSSTANTVTNAAQSNITSVGTLTSLTVSSNVVAGDFYANGGTIQANILRSNSANVTGNLISGNANLGNLARANFFQGDGSLLSNLGAGAFISNGNSNVRIATANGNVLVSVAGNANIAVISGTGVNIAGTLNVTGTITGNVQGSANTVSNAAQPNITSVGTLTSLSVTGNVSAGNVSGTLLSGTLTTAAQPNITSLGLLTSLSVNGNANLLSISNVKIPGGSNGQFIQTDGTGNLTFTSAGLVGGSNTQVQFNDANVANGSSNLTFNKTTGTLTAFNLSVSNVANLGSVSNVKITGGTNTYFLQTDGTGNLTWAPGTGNITGNASAAGSNTQIQISDGAGNFTAASGFTFNSGSNTLSVPGPANITGNFTTTGTTKIQAAKEKVTANGTGSTGTVNFDILDSAILLKTANASANFTINIRGNSTTTLDTVMSTDESLTCLYINRNGATAYYANNFQIDGSNISPIWPNGAPTVGTISGRDQYIFNIIKTAANTYTVFGSRIGYS